MENAKELKIYITSAIATIIYFIGWQGMLFLFLVIALSIDYLTGSMAARKNEQWTSKKASEGRIRKALIFIALIAALILDGLIWVTGSAVPILGTPFEWPFLFTLISTVWFTLSEIGSTVENLAIMGLNLPNFLIKGIKVLKGKVETAGEGLLKEESEVKNGNSI